MRFLLSAFAVLFFVLGAVGGLDAQQNPYWYDVGEGYSFFCNDSSGTPVAISSNASLADVGRASFTFDGFGNYIPLIELNPAVLRQLELRVRMFWFAHECAHHSLGHIRAMAFQGFASLGSEAGADCEAVFMLRSRFRFNRNDIRAVASTLVNSPGSPAGHLPGPARARLLDQCAGF